MTSTLRRRLANQRLAAPLDDAAAVVRRLGAVQAQDYRGALWALALRTRAATEADVERALAERAIVRTWPMRGTLHFVPPEDARWMLRTLAPRVIRRAAARYRQLALDERVFARSRTVLLEALAGGRQLTRAEIFALLGRAGIEPREQRGIHVLAHLAMEGVLCFGGPRGKQPTFTLLDDWVPAGRDLAGDEALAELARRYFAGHAPATAHDFAWWTGLSLGEARRAIELAGATRRREPAASRRRLPALLLPPYDEYTVGYRDRSAILDPADAERTRGGIFSPVVVLGGRIAGTWRRRVLGDRVELDVSLFVRPTSAIGAALARAAARYGRFLGLDPVLRLSPPRARRG